MLAARAALEARAAPVLTPATALAGWQRQLAALLIDLLPVAALAAYVQGLPEWPTVLLLLAVARLLPLIAVGRTLGGAVTGFRVLGPGGARLSPPRALLRELLLPLSLVWSEAAIEAALLRGRPDVARAAMSKELDRRLLPDLLADTWPVLDR